MAKRGHKPVIVDPGAWESDPAKIAGQIGQIKKLGGTMVRIRPSYGEDASRYRGVIQEARRRGLKVIMTPTGGLPNAPTDPTKNYGSAPAAPHGAIPTRGEYFDFVKDLGQQFRGVRNWSAWNEPDLTLPGGAKAYRGMVVAARHALNQSGHRKGRFLIGETSPAAKNGDPDTILKYAKRVLAGKKIRGISGWATHPYAIRGDDPLHKDPGMSIGRLNELAKVTKLPVWITEFGSQRWAEGAPQAMGTADQLRATKIAAKAVAKNKNIKSFAQYLVADDSYFKTGVLGHGASNKQAYKGYKKATSALR